MNDLVKKKDHVIEKLMAVSTQLSNLVERGRFVDIDEPLRERSRIFDELARCDRDLSGVSTDCDERWEKQLSRLKKGNEKMISVLNHNMNHTRKEITMMVQRKMDLLSEDLPVILTDCV